MRQWLRRRLNRHWIWWYEPCSGCNKLLTFQEINFVSFKLPPDKVYCTKCTKEFNFE